MNRKKMSFILAVVFILNIAAIMLVSAADAASFKKGSTGNTVSEIQTALKNQGFYKGTVDGVYGSGTETAVKTFQQSKGLAVDGKVGPATLKAMGISGESVTQGSDAGDLALLARIISAEGRGEPYNGQVAIGAVILNRVDHPSFPNTLSGVIYQNGAFTAIIDGQFDQPISESSYRAARDAMNGVDPCGGAIYYFNPATASNKWIWSRPLIVVIGKHRFCA